MKKSILALGLLAAFAAAGAQAQTGPTTPFSIEPRAGLSIPTGDGSEDLHAGLAFSVDAIYQLTPQVGVYAG
ncbi:MAG TPA: hypothetical protein VEX86_18455, partial [Longimicrobium sp.]|nr:hypothetical protein [Longimicrobium sp.]